MPYGAYLSQAAVLDFILEDESVGVRWLKPTQEDTALAGRLPGEFAWNIIGLSCRKGASGKHATSVSFLEDSNPNSGIMGKGEVAEEGLCLGLAGPLHPQARPSEATPSGPNPRVRTAIHGW